MNRKRHKTNHPGVYYRETPSGRQYMIWFQGTDGKGHFQNVAGGERDAVRARARVVDRIAHGHKVAPSRVLFADFARAWLEEQVNLAPRSFQAYKSQIEIHLIPRLGPRTKLCDVDVNHVAAMVSAMQKEGLKAWTIRAALSPLSGIMRTAVRRGLAPANPVLQLERSEKPTGDQSKMNILDTDEIKLLLARSGDWRPLFTAAIFTGLRISELLALTWEDVDWEEGLLHVRGTKTQAAVREVVLPDFLQQMLASLSLESSSAKTVFEGSRQTAWKALQASLRAAGIEKRVRLHDLRHTYASILISQGHDVVFVAEQMGHANATITLQTYAKLYDKKKRRDQARDRMQAEFGQVLGKSNPE